jgi:hypothetical protein
LQITAERGYLIPAVGDVYERCAQQLADSIRSFHPHAEIKIMTGADLPYGDQGGLANDWQCWYASPFRQTIKLEADMLCASEIDHWWSLFEHKDVVISKGCRDYHDRPSRSRHYRKVFDHNNLIDAYNAITYWRCSETAKQFWSWVRRLFTHWPEYRSLLKFADDAPNTDLVYAMAAEIMGPDTVTLPDDLGPRIVHMKRRVIGTRSEDWTKELIWETDPLRIQTVAQWGLVHYHVKDWKA